MNEERLEEIGLFKEVPNVCEGHMHKDRNSTTTPKAPITLPTIFQHNTVRGIQPVFSITDSQPYTYFFEFVTYNDGNKIWISLHEPCGGFLDGRDYNFYVNKNRSAVSIPINSLCATYAYGTISLQKNPSNNKRSLFFTGGLKKTKYISKIVENQKIAELD